MRIIYLDNASTTEIDPLVLKEVGLNMKKNYGNPGSSHSFGMVAKKILDESRTKIAGVLNSKQNEIVFTSGGTESNNSCILGIAARLAEKIPYEKMNMVTTAIEHSSVLECFRHLESRGVSVDYINPDDEGIVSARAVEKVLRPNTVLVSVMYANNEIGAVQPIRAISNVLESSKKTIPYILNSKPLFHIDACQAPLYLDVNKETLGADMISFDSHKIYGPKGVGCFYISGHIKISSILFGGGQERSLRPGTENIPLVSGFAMAFKMAAARRKSDSEKISRLKKYFTAEIKKSISEVFFNSLENAGLPNIVNISLPGIDADLAVIRLSAKGICCSAKSACRGEGEGSYVIGAIGRKSLSGSSLRFSLGRLSKKSEIDYTVKILSKLFRDGLLSSN